MAAQRVFAIAELFEAILVHLSITELFVNQRVSKHWRTWIRYSGPLSRRMFVTSGPPTTKPETIQANPFMDRLVAEADTPSESWAYPTATWRKTLLFRPVLKNIALDAFVESRSDERHLIDSVDGSGLWRSLTMDRFMREVERKIMARRLMATNLRLFSVVAQTYDDSGVRENNWEHGMVEDSNVSDKKHLKVKYGAALMMGLFEKE
ncbi:hypothetical protein LTR36_001523 [Oleoguttula mirabilis]|uniref:F-box domain-containing protein n=1 Tax=Oleoguttula mirabilis TaxID=1507867 RepID=A0AAV9JN24_9PEZI|nr:hypothetical protein LTR36_001523 [Oleoguttula mirabilis]